jgi:hypothetical protein
MLTNLIHNAVGLFRRHRKLVWFCLLAAMVAIGISLWSREDGEPRPPRNPKPWIPLAFSVSFQGYSNSPSGQRWAILTVTNRDFGDLYFADMMTVDLSNQPRAAQDARWKHPDFIPRRSCGRIVVEVPLAPGSWRAQCMISRWTWRDSVYSALSSRGWPTRLIPVRRTSVMGGIATEWITNQ